MQTSPVPENEMARVISLSDYDLDFTAFENNFEDLAKLAAKIAGTNVSLVNLIDSYTQWTVTGYGFPLEQLPREDSICQFTVAAIDNFEVEDLRTDERFKDKLYVNEGAKFRYYYGVPLTTKEGFNLGALCVMHSDLKVLSPEQTELLKIIADEIVNRLNAIKLVNNLKSKLEESEETRKKVAHDIRGPLGGIIGLSQVISEQGEHNKINEVLNINNMIQTSGRSLLDFADEILSIKKPNALKSDEFNLLVFKDKLEKLYTPQALSKNIRFVVNTSVNSSTITFSKNKLLQITGNLISNAMKFTPKDGKVTVDLSLKIEESHNVLQVNVVDTGLGLSKETIDNTFRGNATSTNGTGGEQGYGFGLALVKSLVESLKGTMHIYSESGSGTNFEIVLPQANKFNTL